MGIGDEIMACGHAEKVHKETGRRVLIVGKDGKRRWSGVWLGVPWIVHPAEPQDDAMRLMNGPQCRPYIKYPFTQFHGMTFSGWRARDHVGTIILTDDEKNFAAREAFQLPKRFVILEPNVKDGSNSNKQWGWTRWQELANIIKASGVTPIQIGLESQPKLDGVRFVMTPDFRCGVALMKYAEWNFLPDGGLHHACAALGLPATVLFGGVNDPEFLGYPDHNNIFHPQACGRWQPCKHCETIWSWIKPADVFESSMPYLRSRLHVAHN